MDNGPDKEGYDYQKRLIGKYEIHNQLEQENPGTEYDENRKDT